MTDPADRAAFRTFEPLVFCPGEQVDQLHIRKPVARGEVTFGRWFGKLVPRAEELAIITAVDAVADARPQFFRNAALEFDGQVRDTTSRIEFKGTNNRAGRANLDTCRARAAMFSDRTVDRQRQIGEQFTQEKPGARILVNQVGVFAYPAEAGVTGQGFFQYRCAVDKCSVTKRARRRLDTVCKFLQTLANDFVVVAAERIARYICAFGFREQFLRGLALVRQVVHARGDNAHGAGYQFLRVAAFAAVFVHVIHLAVEAGVQPAIQARFIVSEADGRYAYLLKAEFPAPAADLFGKL